MVKLLNSLYLGASTPDDYGKATGVIELLPFDLYLGAATPSGVRTLDVLLSGVSPLTLLNAISLNYVKAFGKCAQASTPTPSSPVDIVCNNGTIKVKDDELPVGYKRIESITGDGNLYYDTGKKLYGTDTITITLSGTSTSGQNVIGCYSGTGDEARNFSLFLYGGGSTSNCYLRHGTVLARPRYGSGKRTLVMSPTGTSGFTTDVTYSEETFTTGANCYIFALPNSTSNKFTGKIEGNILISDRLKYIPCERESDNVIGYYETHTQTFLEPEAGTPTAGAYDTSHLTEVYVDGTQEVVTVNGKNLFTTTGETKDKFLNASGVEQNGVYENYQFSYTDYLPVLPNTTYTFSVRQVINTTLLNHRIHEYTENKTWIKQGANLPTQSGGTLGGVVSATFTTSATTKWLRINYVYNPAGENPQLELGSTATDYEPYVTPQTATCENLLSVGTYKDSQNITNGSVVRNVGVKVLKGTEDWRGESGVLYDDIFTGKNTNNGNELCSHYTYDDAAMASMADNTFKVGSTGYPNRVYVKDSVNGTSKAAFNTWLKAQVANGTPVTIVYPLATSVSESVTPQTMTVAQGTNVVTATGSVSDLELEISYKAAVTVTIEEIEAVNTDESVEVTIS